MTRYTRAKGSKASNEKAPNEATPWHIMKQQLAENLSKQQESSKKASVTELLQDNNVGTDENINNEWAEFEETTKRKNSITKQVKQKKKQKTLLKNEDVSLSQSEGFNENKKHPDNITIKQKVSLKRNINKVTNCTADIKVKKRKQDNHDNESCTETLVNNSHTSNIEKTKNNMSVKQRESMLSKRQKRNMRKREKNLNENTVNTSRTNENPIKENKISKKEKRIEFKEYRKRKPDSGTKTVIINGLEIEIVKFDGFPIIKADAERLNDLKQQMVMKGIPKQEIDIALKLERRRAERSLARIRKSVCFHCRKGGHNLSDCPELKYEQTGTGICFKCGSTEHTHFECKVSKPTEFRYATCFICREQGHIAKQCPDNPKGIYPQGGCCKICGDVTHLKKDCPDLIKEKEENTITVNTIANNNLESLEENITTVSDKDTKKSKKIVKF